MVRTHTTPSADDLRGEPIPEEKAAAQNAALDRVLAHLTAAGVVGRASKPNQSVVTFWYPPQLTIDADAGRRLATVSISHRSGSRMIESARVGADDQPQADRVEVVPAGMPNRVGPLVAQEATQ
ncbi:hypothetical protein ABZ912_02090 [Nonomuraea angiospora]|uniref:hypothetical protein n=1 Tax=Nonomuraea angiospora TaxID=46172 RepID=UPI003403F061